MTAILTHAAKRGWCDRPMFDRPKEPPGKTRWLSVDEAEALIAASADHLRPIAGATRAHLANMVEGVTKGYEKKLEIVGVGYIAAIQKNVLQLRVGFANELQVPIPAGLNVTCPDQTHVVVKGIDKQLVGQFAAEVRALRKPEPYKGKGIRYENEQVRRKAGKAVTK
jgi:large subunit ribosomal protein L6